MPGRRSKPPRESRRSSRRNKNKENINVGVMSVFPMTTYVLPIQEISLHHQLVVPKDVSDINEKWCSWMRASVVHVAHEMSRNPCTNDVQRYVIASRVLSRISAGPICTSYGKCEVTCGHLIRKAMSHLAEKHFGEAIVTINAAVIVAPWPTKSTPENKEGCVTDAVDSVDHLHDEQPKTDGCAAGYDGPLQHALMHRIEILIARKEYYEAIADADYMLVAFKESIPRKLTITLVGQKSYCLAQLEHFKMARHCLRRDLVRLGIADKGFTDPGATFPPDLAYIVDLLRSLQSPPFIDDQLGACLPPLKLAPVYPGLEQYREARRKLHLKDGPLSKNLSSLSAAVKFETSKNEHDAGDRVVASRTISPGDVVLIEEAFVSATLCTRRTNTCFACSLWVNVCYPCETCARVVFCSPLCASGTQAQVHKRECAVMPRIGTICFLFSEYGQALEMAVRTVLSRTVPEWRAFRERQRDLLGLPDDLDDRIEQLAGTQGKRRYATTPKDDFETVFRSRKIKMQDLPHGGVECCLLLAAAAMEILDEHHFKPGELDEGMKNFLGGLLLRMVFVYIANGVCITNVGVDESSSDQMRTMKKFLKTGSAVYPNLAAFGRSCDPNVILVFYGDHVVARAWREIRPGEPLTVVASICDLFCANNCCDNQQWHERKNRLACKCHACQGKWPTFSELLSKRDPAVMRMRCSHCNEEVPMRGPQCPTCDTKIRGWKKASSDLDQLVEKLRCVGKPMPISHHDEQLEEKVSLLFGALSRFDIGHGKLTYPMAVLQNCAFELFSLMGNKVFRTVTVGFSLH